MNKSFPTTQALIQSVQQQVQAVVDSNISYNMKVRETLRLSSITLLNDYVLPGASTMLSKSHIRIHLNGLDPLLFEERIILLSMFKDTDWK